jgi:hypothetical protein
MPIARMGTKEITVVELNFSHMISYPSQEKALKANRPMEEQLRAGSLNGRNPTPRGIAYQSLGGPYPRIPKRIIISFQFHHHRLFAPLHETETSGKVKLRWSDFHALALFFTQPTSRRLDRQSGSCIKSPTQIPQKNSGRHVCPASKQSGPRRQTITFFMLTQIRSWFRHKRIH